MRIGIYSTLAAILWAGVLPAQSSRAATRSVTAIRHWSLSDVTRIAIEVSGDFEFRTDRLHNPERVYYDILNARPNIDSKRLYTESVEDKRISRIRVAETNPRVTRVVLDLSGPVAASTSKLANPSRLIIELRSEAPASTVTEVPASSAAPVAVRTAPPVAARAEAPRPEPLKVDLPKVALPKVDLPKAAAPKPERAAEFKPGDAPVRTAEMPGASRSPAPPAARPASSSSTSLVRSLGLKVSRVVIDAGHGGQDQGTESPKGLLEKDLVLDIAKRVGKLIEEQMKLEVIYTRTDDTFVPLEARTAIANDNRADLFLSIHANFSPFPGIAGVETYYLNFPDSREAAAVAARENASAEKSVFELQDVIQKITSHDKAAESREFAGRVQASMQAFSARNFPGIKNRGVKKAGFVVLVGAHMPSVLAEIGFLSNAKEESLLKKPDYRQKLADALFRGVERYAQSLSHFEVVAQAKD